MRIIDLYGYCALLSETKLTIKTHILAIKHLKTIIQSYNVTLKRRK